MDPVIDRLQRRAAARRDLLSLAGGLPAASLFPRQAIARASTQALFEPSDEALQYGWPEGSIELRRWIAARLSRRGAATTAADVLITAGAQQAIGLATTALLSAGDYVFVEPETYPAALDLFHARGVVPTSDLTRAAAAYVMPAVGNPRGVGLAPETRARLLAVGLPLIADEAYAELRFDGTLEPPLVAAAPDRVFHIGTFSKTLCPGLRIGWLVPPRAMRSAVLEWKQEADLQSNGLGQAILVHALRDLDFDLHLERVRRAYARRARALVRALEGLPGFRFRAPEGGFSVFLESDVEGDEARFLEIAAGMGVSFDPGRLFRAGAPAPVALRVCHSSLAPAHFAEAVARLMTAWQAFRREVR